jgi:hypothetical protein
MIVRKTTVFPAGREEVLAKLQQLKTLQHIAWPYASFQPVGKAPEIWTAGQTSSYQFILFGCIPYGTHTIHIVHLDEDGIQSEEGNEHVPVWNHQITLKMLDADHTEYTDMVVLNAGWKTFFIWIWANIFYTHRQRKWIRLLKDEKEKGQ